MGDGHIHSTNGMRNGSRILSLKGSRKATGDAVDGIACAAMGEGEGAGPPGGFTQLVDHNNHHPRAIVICRKEQSRWPLVTSCATVTGVTDQLR